MTPFTPAAALLLLCAARAAAVSVLPMVAAGDFGASSFQLLRVDYSNASSPFTPIGAPLHGWALVQGDATAYDGVSTYYAVLTAASQSNGHPDLSSSSLFALDITTGAVLWNYSGFPANYTMGALAWEPTQGLVGLCGSLLIDLKVEGYCGVDVVTGARVPRLINDWHWSLSYDPDTRALDPTRHVYYHRLYNASWLPDYYVTLDSRTGEVLHTVQFWSPEFSGTRVDTRTGGLWSICNAPNGLDLCGVDPVTGGFAPTGAFDQLKEDEFLLAATAVIDPVHSFYSLVVEFAVDGTFTRIVDINASSPTFGRIVANLTALSNPFPSNFHAIGTPDD